MWLTDDCAKTHKPWVKSRVSNSKLINRMVQDKNNKGEVINAISQ